jgi:uncharacterized protein YodC (DUF2158 family)
MEQSEEITVGDIVTLKSGSPKLVVGAIGETGDQYASCYGYNEVTYEWIERDIPLAALKLDIQVVATKS